jgi:osmotically inducible lipoprotein OsmB
MSILKTTIILSAIVFATTACGDTWGKRAVTGGAIGAGSGAVVGGVTGVGGAVGAGVGAATTPDHRY